METIRLNLSIVVLFLSLVSQAQSPHWEWVLQGGGDKDEIGKWVHCRPDLIYLSGDFYKYTTIGDTTLDGAGTWAAFIGGCTKTGEWEFVMNLGSAKENFQDMEVTENDEYLYGVDRFEVEVEIGNNTYTNRGSYDFFIVKRFFGKDGVIWSLHGGGPEYDDIGGLTVDQYDNCYITGRFAGTAQFGPFSLTSKAENDLFVAKISKDGEWLWVQSAGGTAHDIGKGIAVDKSGNVYITGAFQLDAQFGNTKLQSTGNVGYSDVFIAKLDPNGNWLWAKNCPGDYTETGKDIAVDKNGYPVVIGEYDYNINIGGNSFQSKGSTDIFVAKANPNGEWVWTISASGSGTIAAEGIDVDDNGDTYVIGYFKGSPNFGNHTVSVDKEKDLFVAKIVE